ncbi:MAG: hypothetical protein AAFV25_27540, partial [Bacteroidota bacterium]
MNPEGFTISPDGKLIAVSKMGIYYGPMDFPLFGTATFTGLLAFDETNGQYQSSDPKKWDGILPEGITFDVNKP